MKKPPVKLMNMTQRDEELHDAMVDVKSFIIYIVMAALVFVTDLVSHPTRRVDR